MKLSTLILAIIIMMAANMPMAAQMHSDTGNVAEVVANTSLSKSDQWHNLKRWVALTFDKSDVIDMEDAERGTMVIKWSYPVTLDSDFISAAVVATYLVDVRDGKYRLRKISPRVNFQFIRPAGIEGYDSEMIERANSDIRLLNGLAKKFYGGSFEWPVDEAYDEIVAAYLEYLDSTEKYRSDRDRERNKVSDEWRGAEHSWQLLNAVRRTYREIDASMTASLDSALRQNDDF